MVLSHIIELEILFRYSGLPIPSIKVVKPAEFMDGVGHFLGIPTYVRKYIKRRTECGLEKHHEPKFFLALILVVA